MGDKFEGMGGSYIQDEKTGERVQMEAPTVDHPEGNKAREAVAGAQQPMAAQPPAYESHDDMHA